MKDRTFEKLLSQAKDRKISADEREAQRRSFAFGNVNIDNPNVTREMVDRAADELKKGKA